MDRAWIPWAMAAGRAALGPVLVVGAACGWNGLTLAGMVLAALVSDIFDGVLARRWGCDTAGVRLFDTLADTFFYGWTAVALWRYAPGVWRENAGLLAAVGALEVLHLLFDLAKFGRPASYHSYLAKAWGLVLASAVMGAFALGRTNGLVTVALWLGVACKVEGMAMSGMLREWRRDVKTLAVAWRMRGEMRVGRNSRVGWQAAMLVVLVLMSRSSFAVGKPGTLDLTSSTTLFLLEPTPVDSAASRQIAAPCLVIEERAVPYFEGHHFIARSSTHGDDISVGIYYRKDALTPSAKALVLNRFSVHKYTLPRHLSPMKAYDDFRLEGHLRLVKAPKDSCNATLHFEISAYGYVWAIAAIDDGYRSKFISNGMLERLYLDAIGDLFTGAKP